MTARLPTSQPGIGHGSDTWRAMVRSVFVDEAAALLGVSRRTVYYRIKEGRLRTVRTACRTQRVLIESIEDLLREQIRRQGECGSAPDLAAPVEKQA